MAQYQCIINCPPIQKSPTRLCWYFTLRTILEYHGVFKRMEADPKFADIFKNQSFIQDGLTIGQEKNVLPRLGFQPIPYNYFKTDKAFERLGKYLYDHGPIYSMVHRRNSHVNIICGIRHFENVNGKLLYILDREDYSCDLVSLRAKFYKEMVSDIHQRFSNNPQKKFNLEDSYSMYYFYGLPEYPPRKSHNILSLQAADTYPDGWKTVSTILENYEGVVKSLLQQKYWVEIRYKRIETKLEQGFVSDMLKMSKADYAKFSNSIQSFDEDIRFIVNWFKLIYILKINPESAKRAVYKPSFEALSLEVERVFKQMTNVKYNASFYEKFWKRSLSRGNFEEKALKKQSGASNLKSMSDLRNRNFFSIHDIYAAIDARKIRAFEGDFRGHGIFLKTILEKKYASLR